MGTGALKVHSESGAKGTPFQRDVKDNMESTEGRASGGTDPGEKTEHPGQK